MKTVFRFSELVAILLAITAVLGPRFPAQAAGVVATSNASVTLPLFPGVGSVNKLSGNVTGVGTGQPSGALSLGNIQYSETTCAYGSAFGTINIGSTAGLTLQWNRVGATALIRLTGDGQTVIAAAIFVPNAAQTVNHCVTPGTRGPLTASIVAVGVAGA